MGRRGGGWLVREQNKYQQFYASCSVNKKANSLLGVITSLDPDPVSAKEDPDPIFAKGGSGSCLRKKRSCLRKRRIRILFAQKGDTDPVSTIKGSGSCFQKKGSVSCFRKRRIRIMFPQKEDPDPVSTKRGSGSCVRKKRIRILCPQKEDPDPVSAKKGSVSCFYKKDQKPYSSNCSKIRKVLSCFYFDKNVFPNFELGNLKTTILQLLKRKLQQQFLS